MKCYLAIIRMSLLEGTYSAFPPSIWSCSGFRGKLCQLLYLRRKVILSRLEGLPPLRLGDRHPV